MKPEDIAELASLIEAGDDGEPCKIEAGYLLVKNPKFAEDNGLNPYLGVDLYAILASLRRLPAPPQDPLQS